MMREQSFSGPNAESALAMRVAGIDLDRLMADIGEASACTSKVELFRLCVEAQRVLGEVFQDWTKGTR